MEFSEAKTHFIFSKKKKKDFLLKEGEISTDYFLILDGYVRKFYLGENGTEVTIELLGKGEFSASMYSLLQGAASFENIQCLTNYLVCQTNQRKTGFCSTCPSSVPRFLSRNETRIFKPHQKLSPVFLTIVIFYILGSVEFCKEGQG